MTTSAFLFRRFLLVFAALVLCGAAYIIPKFLSNLMHLRGWTRVAGAVASISLGVHFFGTALRWSDAELAVATSVFDISLAVFLVGLAFDYSSLVYRMRLALIVIGVKYPPPTWREIVVTLMRAVLASDLPSDLFDDDDET